MSDASCTNVRSAFKPIYDDYKRDSAKHPEWMPRPPFQLIYPDRRQFPRVGILPAGDVIGPHGQLLNFLRHCEVTGRRNNKLPTTVEAHHLLEDRLMLRFGITHAEGLCVSLEQTDHNLFSRELPGHLPRGRDLMFDIDYVFDAHREMYVEHGHREWVPVIAAWVKSLEARIMGHYATGFKWKLSAEDKKRIESFFKRLPPAVMF